MLRNRWPWLPTAKFLFAISVFVFLASNSLAFDLNVDNKNSGEVHAYQDAGLILLGIASNGELILTSSGIQTKPGLNGIAGTGLRGIAGTGLYGIAGTGLRGIAGTGLYGIAGTGLRGIAGTGLRGIAGTGLRSIAGDEVNRTPGFKSAKNSRSASIQAYIVEPVPMASIGQISAISHNDKTNSILVNGQSVSFDDVTTVITVKNESISLTSGIKAVQILDAGDYVAIAGDIIDAGRQLATYIVQLPIAYSSGSSPVYVRVQLDSDPSDTGIVNSGATWVDQSNALSNSLLTTISQSQTVEYLGFSSELAPNKIFAISGAPVRAFADNEPNSIAKKGLRGIAGTGLYGIAGTGLRGIAGTGLYGIAGTGLRGIAGTGLYGIAGTGLQSASMSKSN